MQIIRKGSTAGEIETPRVMTGLYSFDWAFIDNKGNAGLPLRSMIEITGSQGVGKSTVMFSLAGKVAKNTNRDIYLLDLERQNSSTLSSCLNLSGFDGKFTWDVQVEDFIPNEEKTKKSKSSKKSDDKTADDLLLNIVELVGNKEHPIIMIDSIAVWQPDTVNQSTLSDKNIGVKATALRRWFEKMLIPLNGHPIPPVVFFTNHLTQDPGGFRPSFNSPVPTIAAGGTAVGYCSTQIIHLSNLHGFSYPEQHGWVTQGKLRKNRDGYGIESKQIFFLYIQAGEGINANLTAVIDCHMLGLAKSSATNVTESSTISIDGNKVGQFRDLIAERHNDDLFLPFHNALKSVTGGIKEVSTAIGE